jgi:hypothetical protein
MKSHEIMAMIIAQNEHEVRGRSCGNAKTEDEEKDEQRRWLHDDVTVPEMLIDGNAKGRNERGSLGTSSTTEGEYRGTRESSMESGEEKSWDFLYRVKLRKIPRPRA